MCRIRGLTFGGGGGGVIFGGLRYGYIWVLFLKKLLSEGVSCKVRYGTVPQNQNFSPSAPTMGEGGGGAQVDTISYCTKNLIRNLVP